MKVYIVADLTVHDPETYQKYIEQVPATVTKYGGHYLVRAGKVTGGAEGWQPQGRRVIIEFSDQQAYERWKNSDEYQTVAKIRESASTSRAFLAEGFEASGS